MRTDERAPDPALRTALTKAAWRILPLLCLGYGIAYMDRSNISFASLQMNDDLKFSAAVYGLGAGLFFLSYAALEVPSNLLLVRFGARRWLARIMLTWGVLSVGMMFVKTPMQFYVMRFLLGMAEAGFFPGVVFYLSQWFPAQYRGRAMNGFYFAFPLSSVVMGAVAGPLLNLDDAFGLAGWQWLFLMEGLPAIALSGVIFFCLADSPAQAAWLTDAERSAIQQRLANDRAALGGADHSLWRALLDPRVLRLGICNFCIMFAGYAYLLSAPAVLQSATGWNATRIGLLVSLSAVAGSLTMLLNGWHSDRHRERYLHTVTPLVVIACAFLVAGLTTAPWIAAATYAVVFIAITAVQSTFWLIPGDSMHGRSAAIGVAAIGSIGMIGAFAGPSAFGWLRDHTGSYQAGLAALFIPYALAATILLRARFTERAQPSVGAGVVTAS